MTTCRSKNHGCGGGRKLSPCGTSKEEYNISDQLELTNADEVVNAVFDCITSLAESPVMEWDMEIIGNVTDSIKHTLYQHGVRVRHPAVVTDRDGNQSYSEYDDYETEGA